ncbi:hypothetical protein CDD81_7899 [Ophiocordyceps australis]|uniref:Uncharacterized protein n=1 Tax=Ophiocordyceps australis TaxID=1399860 RepID=A0A2C5YF21_9HYPO|nr:hypothetical protein CDD81_7899 [Ophiocordyceps australis]
MKGRPVDELVYEQMFPRPRATDPQTFNALLQRSLIPEVRRETKSFYGHFDTQEAKYPGLDYNHDIHRVRLSRWQWHRRLFRAFDELRLTHSEIAGLTKWEGTKWAKEKFEMEQGIVIRDTTADGLVDWTQSSHTGFVDTSNVDGMLSRRSDDDDDDDDETNVNDDEDANDDMVGNHDEHIDDNASDDSLDITLAPPRPPPRATTQDANSSRPLFDDVPTDEEDWEYWLKQALESGDLAIITGQSNDQVFRRVTSGSSIMPAALIPPDVLDRARAGQWEGIPDLIRPILRHAIDGEDEYRNSSFISRLLNDDQDSPLESRVFNGPARVQFTLGRTQTAQPE